jgi:hypothetical protein
MDRKRDLTRHLCFEQSPTGLVSRHEVVVDTNSLRQKDRSIVEITRRRSRSSAGTCGAGDRLRNCYRALRTYQISAGAATSREFKLYSD